MRKEEITAIFDQQASSYDQQWSKLASINDALHLLTSAVLSELPPTANILCIGSGTGTEILYLAQRFPEWRFTAVEPSVPMLDAFRSKAEENGILSRCFFHSGYIESLPESESFDGATVFLVSQFILDRDVRSAFFREIARRLRSQSILVSSDLTADFSAIGSQSLLEIWFRLMKGNRASPEGVMKMREAYTRDVAVLPSSEVRDIIMHGGFESPVPFFQAGMIHAWFAKRSLNL